MIDLRYRLVKDVKRICNHIEDCNIPEYEASAHAAAELLHSVQSRLMNVVRNVPGKHSNDAGALCAQLSVITMHVERLTKRMQQERREREKDEPEMQE